MSTDSFVALRDVAFRHSAASEPLFTALSVHLPRGFTGVVGANGAGKTTLLELVMGRHEPERGSVEAPGFRVLCAQRTDRPPPELEPFLAADDREACVLRGRLGLDALRARAWATLSHGERKRLQIAAALWQGPDLLAIDEPTNHIDAEARALLMDALRRFRGVGLIVSHDREFLDGLCTRCLWMEPPTATLFEGGLTSARAQREALREQALREQGIARRARDELVRETTRRREVASRSDARRSRRGLARKDADGRARRNLARVSGKDGQAGRLLSQLDGRVRAVETRLDGAFVEARHELGIWITGAPSRRSQVLAVEAGCLPLGGGRVLRFPALRVRPGERVAVTGANGAGKSTLLRHLLATQSLQPERVLFLPQELDAEQGRSLLELVRRLPSAELGMVMNVVSRLGSRPERLLASTTPSPGELRKLMLARGITREPHLVVMDEPTNHLDLPSIECLQSALADCPCALLLVSHDVPFLSALTSERWCLRQAGDGDSLLEMESMAALA
ncbi:MAG TPA: ATP-binding cassette domain-containing protein [Pseudomonadales bacterium]|nr:ATP-binding cassette domain-containing protein [Pseudomonadales bacterium]